MKFRKTIQKVLAIALLLLFSQKIGVGLYLHNLLHLRNCDQSSLPDPGRGVSQACHCIDDFSAPLVETAAVELPAIPLILSAPVSTEQVAQVSTVACLNHLFRGPPEHSSFS